MITRLWVFLLLSLAATGVGCTNLMIKPLSGDPRIKEIVIVENPKAQDPDFLAVLVEGFQRHGIATQVVKEAPATDAYVATYVAYRIWDIAWYLNDATITITRGGQRVSQAIFHLKAGGGFAPNKWASTKAKIDPVIDELLAQYPASAPAAVTAK
jgi:hypothetical protein